MAQQVLSGFQDVISRTNLTSNGSFRINQRGNFTTATACKEGDYICDCWLIVSMTVPYCEATFASGKITFTGYGSKGQLISLRSKDATSFGYGDIMKDTTTFKTAITSALLGKNLSSSVPIDLLCYPRYYASAYNILYNTQPILKPGDCKEAVSVWVTNNNIPTYGGTMTITLKDNGKFDITIYNYRELAGAFRNPPGDCFVPYTDDLARCEAYYQTGSYTGDVYVPFRTKMAGTPSIILSSGTASSISNSGFVVSSSSGVYTWTATVA